MGLFVAFRQQMKIIKSKKIIRRYMMKKFKLLSLLLAGAMAASLFAACGDNDKGGDNSGDTGNTGNTGDTGNTGNTGNTGDTGNTGNTGNTGGSQDTSTKYNGKIYFVGDSTVCSFGDTDVALYIPRYGYGTQLYNYVNCEANQIVNLALSGRSSYSFTKEGNYSTLTSGITAGDYLLIGFGHNDEKFEVDRYADPTLASDDTSTMIGTYNAERAVSFKYILKHYYIDVAKAAGATPILCTPIVRLSNDSSKYDSDHTTTSKTNYQDSTSKVTTDWNGGNYAQAIRDLAQEEGLTCIDLTTTTKNDYKTIGYDEAIKYHSIKSGKWTDATKTAIEADLTSVDNTHTNRYGAKMNAYHIASAIKASNLPLASSIKTTITKPVYADNATAIINADYKVPENKPFNPDTDASAKWSAINGTELNDGNSETVYKWYGTAFGANLGTSNIATASQFTITKGSDADGVTFTVNADSGKGKIQSGDDSLVAVFIQIPFETAFSVSATATLNTFSGVNQSGFGMMLRDDIAVDKLTTMKGNYINAGCIVSSNGTNKNVYAGRLNGTQFFSGTKQEFATATPYNLSIARTSQSVTATVGANAAYSAVKDFDLGASDSKFVYLCLWATRGTNVTFSNITFASSEWTQA